MELSGNQHPLEDKEQTSSCKSHRLNVVTDNKEEKDKTLMNINEHLDYQNDPNKSMLIHRLGRDMSINCLIRCSRVDYEAIALVNNNFRSLINSGELYKLRRKAGIVEYWVYYSCDLLEWEAFDLVRGRCMSLPRITSTECFMCSDKESLAVGTEVLVFEKDILSQVIYRYNILMNEWTSGMQMNDARFLFASSSVMGIGILAGGCDPLGNIMKSAKLYNSESGTSKMLPSMNKARKLCSGVFMDEKFYVLRGIGEGDTKPLTCAEEFNLETKTWRLIPNMLPHPRSWKRFL